MPGLYGDILQSLATCRAVAEHFAAPVSLWISHHFGSLATLIREQEYIDECYTAKWNLAVTGPVYTLERYESGDQGPWRAPSPAPKPGKYMSASVCYLCGKPCSCTACGGLGECPCPWPTWDHVADLQYRGWPAPTCSAATAANAEEDLGLEPGTLKVDLARPWVRTRAQAHSFPLLGNWRHEDPDKARFQKALARQGGVYVAAPLEVIDSTLCQVIRANWQETAALLAWSGRFVCCQSAPWVLASAVGHPHVEVLEPDERRHDETFWIPAPGNRRIGWEAVER